MEKKRLDYVDIARGLAILLVIFGHVKYEYVPFCGSVHIAVFFFLSGYLYQFGKVPEISYTKQVIRRVKRLVIPYFVYNAVLYLKYLAKVVTSPNLGVKDAVSAALGSVYSSSILWKNVAPDNNFHGFVFGNGPLWFLTSMAISCAVFYALMYFVMKHRYHLGKLLASVVVLLAVTVLLCQYLPFYLPWTAEMALVGTIFMIFGSIARHYEVGEWISNHPVKSFVVSVVCVAVFSILHALNGLANMAACEYGNYLSIFVVLGLLGTFVMLYLAIMLGKVGVLNQALCYIGRRTMVILAFHMTIIALFVSALSKIHLEALATWDGLWLITFPMSLAVCLLIGEFMNRVLKLPKSLL